MRGIGHTLSRLPTARGLVAGVALLASAAASAAQGQGSQGGDQTAMAIPRIEAPRESPGHSAGGSSVNTAELALPQPLAPSEATRIRRILAAQSAGRIGDAERETGQLTSGLLTGTILAERYLGRFHHATATELTQWLRRYADQPGTIEQILS